MTKEEFAAALEGIREQQNILLKRERLLYGQYLDDNRKFADNDKVTLKYKTYRNKIIETPAFINSFSAHEDGETYYGFRKVKQDGSKSSHRFNDIDEIISIELLEPAKP